MRCAGCGDDQFSIDETTGRYICTSCWQVSDFFEGLTQDEAVETRGLRALNKQPMTSMIPSQLNMYSQSQLFNDGPLPLLANIQHSVKREEVEYEDWTKKIKKEEENKGANMILNAKIERKKVDMPKREHRPWRLSEPFALVLMHQFRELVRTTFKPEHKEGALLASRFRQMTWDLWINYLAITGELGPSAWALSFITVAKATQVLLQSREEYIDTMNGRCSRTVFLPVIRKSENSCRTRLMSRRKTEGCIPPAALSTANLWSAVQLRLGSFQWAGWGALYNPNDPSSYTEKMMPPPPDSNMKSAAAVQESVTPVADDAANESFQFDGDDDDGGFEDIWDLQSITSSHTMFYLTHQNRQIDEFLEKKEGITALELAWKETLTENLANQHVGREIFWRGQTARGKQLYLLEYNLGLLFLSSLLTLSTPVVENGQPGHYVLKHGFITLHDLHTMCRTKKFPFMTADHVITPWFVIFDCSLARLFQRAGPPNMKVLAHISWLLIHMLGIRERPRLPLCSMVHRYLRELQFPPEAHELANNLIQRLGKAVASTLGTKGLHYWIPLARYVRGEVHAMAVVVVIARQLFKLNSDFEYCWSNVARFLAEKPVANQTLHNLVNNTTTAGADYRAPFIWQEWASNIDAKFGRRLAVSLTVKTRGATSSQRPVQADPVNSASGIDDLQWIQSAEEFLAASEFNVQTQRGWGEQHLRQDRKCPLFAQPEIKLSLTNPLSDLLNENVFRVAGDFGEMKLEPVSSVEQSKLPTYSTATPPSCAFCERDKACSFFQQVDPSRVVDSSCNALLGAHRFLQHQHISPSLFLAYLFPEVPPKHTVDNPYHNWLHILNFFDSYEPISSLDFSTNRTVNDTLVNRFTVPRCRPAVDDFVLEHEHQLLNFLDHDEHLNSSLSSSSSASSLSEHSSNKENGKIHSSNGNSESISKLTKKPPSDSLSWFLALACQACGAANQQSLLLEVEGVEWFLDLIEMVDTTSKRYTARKMKHIALACAFDYNVR